MNWKRIVIGLVGLLALILVILYFVLRPQVVSRGPELIADGVSRFSPLEITFSREMRTESVEERLVISPEVPGEFSWEGTTLRFTPDGGWPAGAAVEVHLAKGALSRLGLSVSDDLSWLFQVSSVQIAYIWPAASSGNIYLMDLDTGDPKQLTESGGVINFAVSPDGLLIYYFSNNTQGGSDLYMVDRFVGERRRMLTCQRALCSEVVISPDGEWLAYQHAETDIWVLPLNGGGKEFRVSGSAQTASFPAWSADGLLSYYDAEVLEFHVFDVAAKQLITSWPNQAGELGVWTPKGDEFAAPDFFEYETNLLRGPTGEEFNQEVDQSELEPVWVTGSHLQLYQLDAGRVVDLTEEDLAEDYSPVYSPDGTLLAFTRRYLDEVRWTPGRQVWLMPVTVGGGGGPRRQLTDDPDYEYSALSWHPEGGMLAAVRFNVTLLTESPEIWLLDLNGGAARLVIGGYSPQWVP